MAVRGIRIVKRFSGTQRQMLKKCKKYLDILLARDTKLENTQGDGYLHETNQRPQLLAASVICGNLLNDIARV